MDRTGILPLGKRDLAKAFPDLFTSQSRARDALRAMNSNATNGDRGDGQFGGAVPYAENAPTPTHGPPHRTGDMNETTATDTTHPHTAKSHPLNGGAFQIEYLFGFHPHYRRATYRRVGQRGKDSFALIDTERHPDPEAALATLLGTKIAFFELYPTQCTELLEKKDGKI